MNYFKISVLILLLYASSVLTGCTNISTSPATTSSSTGHKPVQTYSPEKTQTKAEIDENSPDASVTGCEKANESRDNALQSIRQTQSIVTKSIGH